VCWKLSKVDESTSVYHQMISNFCSRRHPSVIGHPELL